MASPLSLWLRNVQIVLYLVFVSLWFKGNFNFSKNIPIAFTVPLGLLVAVTGVRIGLRRREKKQSFRIRLPKSWKIPAMLLLIAVVIRLPFFPLLSGLFHSDDALAFLTSKHIAEGQLPAIYHYGQNYLGTLPYHLYALIFKFTGPSILAMAIVYVLFYLAFIVIQFILFKELTTSTKLSALLALFYCLPIGELLGASFLFGGHISIYLFLGSLCIYLSLLVYKYERIDLLPFIGLLLGLAFWTHPIVLIYGICSVLFIVWRYRFKIKMFLTLAAFFFLGFFPAVLYEINNKFGILRFLFSGQKYSSHLGEKIRGVFQEIQHLLTPKINFWNWLFIGFLGLGIIIILVTCIRKKRLYPELVFVVFFLALPIIYIFSKFSAPELAGTRYLYPLYFAIPYLLFSPLRLLPAKFRTAGLAALLTLITLVPNAKETYLNYREIKHSNESLKDILEACAKTGEKYWAGEFWEVILLTGLSKEKIIGWSYSHEDYYPYRLMYFNDGRNNNFLFFKGIHGAHDLKFKDFGQVFYDHLSRTFEEAEKFIRLLKILNIPATTYRIDNCWLIYNVSADVFPQAITSTFPGAVPDVTLSAIKQSGESIGLTFNLSPVAQNKDFRLGVEIPGYSSLLQDLLPDESQIQVMLPFPPEDSFFIQYYLDYVGMKIPATAKIKLFSPSQPRPSGIPGKILCLWGFGPKVRIFGKPMTICTQKTKYKLECSAGQKGRLIFHIYSPFQFSDSYWYGTYEQRLDILINNQFLRSEYLRDGFNRLALNLDHPLFRKGLNIISFVAKYHLPFEFAPLWKTSYLLEKTELEY